MRFITQRALSRRALLRGAGAALALPLLDAMTPALGKTAAPHRRLGFVYVPNGVIMDRWTPSTVGATSSSRQFLNHLRRTATRS